jgi:hypothetical protein
MPSGPPGPIFMARPSILTEELIAGLCKDIRISGSIESAIAHARIGRETFYGWQRNVAAGRGKTLEKLLITEIRFAEAQIKLLREAKLATCPKNWQCLAWWLERKFPGEYGQRHPPYVPESEGGEKREVSRIVWRKSEKAPTAPPELAPVGLLPQEIEPDNAGVISETELLDSELPAEELP